MKKFIHVDMDCFFAAIEMRDNPLLSTIPLAIGGSVQARGVISTANYVARQYGVHSAMPTAQALKLCPHLKLLPGRMEHYEQVSTQINQIFARYTSLIEPISLDEACLDVTHCTDFQGSATLIAEDIRQSIWKEINLTASAGVSSVKFLAKVASDVNKPNGIFCIPPDQVKPFLVAMPIRKIPGIGPKTEERMHQLGFKTCGDVQSADASQLLKEFGKFGLMIWQRCHGIDENEVCINSVRKTVGVETTLPKDIYMWEDCEQLINALFTELVRRLEEHGVGYNVKRQGVKFKFDDFSLTSHDRMGISLNLELLLTAAKHVWDCRRLRRGVRLVGIHATLPERRHANQLALDW